MKKPKISSNMEDYLEAIAGLKKDKGVARVRDISRLMNVQKPSVTAALNTLSKDGLVIHEKYGYAELTKKGERIAQSIQNRHAILLKFLTEILNIDLKTASKDACRMEHSTSPESMAKLTKFIEFMENCPEEGRPTWLKNFDYYARTGKHLKCQKESSKK